MTDLAGMVFAPRRRLGMRSLVRVRVRARARGRPRVRVRPGLRVGVFGLG